MNIKDAYNRTFKTLRISLTNACNLGCSYCVSENSSKLIKKSISHIQIAEYVRLMHELLQLETIRLTGGEPTLYKEIIPLIKALKSLNIPIKMTSNGYKLQEVVSQLSPFDLHSINISLDSVDEEIFNKVSKKTNVKKILDVIEYCLSVGFKIKLNAVIIKNLNESQIIPLLEYSFSRGVEIRFLELMKMGHFYSNKDFENNFFSESEILNTISSKYNFTKLPREPHSTANYWIIDNFGTFGIIANESSPFCEDCDRLRMNTEGQIFGCLSNPHGIDISNYNGDLTVLKGYLAEALSQKQVVKFSGSELKMIDIGG
jgi:cyclic pyranopterin phosphate synthase